MHSLVAQGAQIIGVTTEITSGIYGATKAYLLTLSQSLTHEFGAAGVYVQAVLPGATRTDIWQHAGRDISQINGVMEVGDLVDVALVGFDRCETVTIASLPDAHQWEAFETARLPMRPNFTNSKSAARYRAPS